VLLRNICESGNYTQYLTAAVVARSHRRETQSAVAWRRIANLDLILDTGPLIDQAQEYLARNSIPVVAVFLGAIFDVTHSTEEIASDKRSLRHTEYFRRARVGKSDAAGDIGYD
jgi:hypothetical protein